MPHDGSATKAAPLLPEVKTKFEQLETKAMAKVDFLEQKVSALADQVKENAGHTQIALQALESKVEHVVKMEDRFEQVSPQTFWAANGAEDSAFGGSATGYPERDQDGH